MSDGDYDRFEQYARDGFHPHHGPKPYTCGWCGRVVSSIVGLHKAVEVYSGDSPFPSQPQHRRTDIRICPECWVATTFAGGNQQLPAPLKGDNLDAREESDDAQLIVALYNEARRAVSQRAPSCAVLMFRKILMHLAVEQGAKANLRFVEYVEYLKNNNIVGRPQYALLDRIRGEGNDENHEVRRASPEQAEDLLNLATLLIRSVYFST